MSTPLEIANACIPSAESELPILPHARAILVGVAADRIAAEFADKDALIERLQKELKEAREALEAHRNDMSSEEMAKHLVDWLDACPGVFLDEALRDAARHNIGETIRARALTSEPRQSRTARRWLIITPKAF